MGSQPRVEQLTGQLHKFTVERELAIARAIEKGATWAEVAQLSGAAPRQRIDVTAGCAMTLLKASSGSNVHCTREFCT